MIPRRISIDGRRWFRRGAGGTYCTVRIAVDGETVHVAPSVQEYCVDLVAATRDPKGAGVGNLTGLIDNGASVRGSIALVKVAKAAAVLGGRSYVSPHDVKSIAVDVLRHRVLPSYEAEAQGKTSDHLIAQVLENVPVSAQVCSNEAFAPVVVERAPG